MFNQLNKIIEKPKTFEFYTIEKLWNGEHVSKQMLKYHLGDGDAASRNQGFIDASAEFIKERFELNSDKAVIDFGCGPGLYTKRFAKTGANVTGIDLSINSIKHALQEAERENLNINYINMNYLDYEGQGNFDLATLIFCDYCVLSPSQRSKLLSIMRQSLKDGGEILVDVATDKMYEKRTESYAYNFVKEDGFWFKEAYHEFKTCFNYDAQRVSLDKYVIIKEDETLDVYNWLKYFTLDEIKREFHEAGLEILEYYSDVSGKSYEEKSEIMALIAKKI
ncbi:class I SAM-dependent methyltransferase [Fusibacter sp. JL216-2]|uniref:class I SAM-dependent methyltransferase n=1 Tax=Fusibacter sp. JL216-2 TaxID=3071453 RepID=UPI003D32E57E